ncbi:60S ribosomal protein L18a-like protein [Neltuma alba]|uniref:60S ribosomal protein L18a-like protein n=1 Tax=Neltuma alba TaxID=207710 RepID=UPI0010A35B2A|nr:60S ribosomal protein L18a-like protein [Prosopis alba]
MSKDNHVEAASGEPPQRDPSPLPPSTAQQYPPPQKGTFEVVYNNPPAPQPTVGAQYPHGHQAPPPGYTVADGMPVREPPLPCGIGYGWFLFVSGLLLGAIPWYVGAILLCCSNIDPREKPGCIACAAAAVVFTIAIVIIAIMEAHH